MNKIKMNKIGFNDEKLITTWVYFNFHYYIQNKPIAKMFIAIVNTCSLILYCCLLSHGEHHQESRLPCHTNTKQRMYTNEKVVPASIHQLQSSWQLWAFLVLHMHMDMLHKWSRSIAASTTIAAAASMPSGHVTHLTTWREFALYGVNTKDAAGLTALHVVCTNRVALFQAMQGDVSNDHEQLGQLWRYKPR